MRLVSTPSRRPGLCQNDRLPAMTTLPPRVRFAPSPTGYLHVGGARTALFNWLYARHHGGTFVLRIEDTDVERSSEEMVEGILVGLRWLGLDWDEGPFVGGPHEPYFQSGRLEHYRALAQQLAAQGHAYYDYRTADEITAARTAVERGESDDWAHHRASRDLDPAQVAAYEAEERPRAIRFRVPDGTTTVHDVVHGDITFDHAHIEDFVILRSDGHPTYHLSVVADDVAMQITTVVRGDDHISNTPKQVLLYRALGAAVPEFAHVPLILGPDKKRLSKRHGATSVIEYRAQGILPEAMVNFLALLGWSPGSDQEMFTRDELVHAFSLEGISGGDAVFNPEKLAWFNIQHMMRLSDSAIVERVTPDLEAAGLWRPSFASGHDEHAFICSVIALLKPRLHALGDVVEQARPLISREITYDEVAVAKHAGTPEMRAHLAALADACEALEVLDADAAEQAVRGYAERAGFKAGAMIHATRVALTGRTVSPGLFDVMALLGRAMVVERLRALAAR
jgi:glutamyl-tRNA synthetase